MKNKIVTRALGLLLALVCIMGVLPLSAFAAEWASDAPAYVTQQSADYWRTNGRLVRYQSASSTINNAGRAHVFDAQVSVPGLSGTTRALCSHHIGTLGSQANGQKWNYRQTVDNASLKVLLTYVYSHTNGNFTDAGKARGLETWGEFWSDLWYITAQTMTWYWEYGLIKDVTTDREGFIEQASEEMITSFKVIHDVWNFSPWIKDWDSITIHSIIDSSDGGKTGNSAYDYIKTGVDLVLDHPEYYYNYNLWEFEWDKSQPWKLTGQSGVPMQRLLIAVPGEPDEESVKLTVKKLEAGSNKPLPGVTFTVESADGSGDYSVTRQTGADGTFTLTSEADDLSAGQFTITEEAVPEGYVAQTASQTVTVMPNGSVANTFTFYNEPNQKEGGGSIRKVDSDNPTVGIPGAVIRITSVKLDDGGSYFGEFVTKDGGYVLKEDLDFSKLPKGSYLAEEITPPQGFILSSDVSKVKQPFVWDGKTDVSLVFENSSKVKVQLKKVDESGSPLAGAVFLVLRDGQIISTEATQGDGTITVSNVSEGHYEFVEVSAPEGMDCDKTPVGVHVNAEDLQGEQTITVTKMNHHKRSLTITKRDAESGTPISNTSFHIRGVNLGYEHDVVTGADGKVVLESMPSGCFEIEETAVPSPWLLDANNRKTVWIDASKDKDITVDFVNSTRPGIRILKLDGQTGKPIAGATFLIEEVNGGFSDRRQTDQDGLIVLEGKDGVRPGAYKISEVAAAPNYVLDDTVHVVQLEENRTTTIELTNLVKPTLKILKVDSITKNPVAHAKFQIWRASSDTKSGDYNDLGTFYSNEAGEIVLEHTEPGWFKISELEAPSGYSIKQADYEFYLAAGETKTVQVENIPLSALVVYKYDRVTGEPVEGAIFQVKYLSGTSGTGGTVIGTYRTLKNGSFTVTGLQAGAYVVEELASDSGHIVDAAPQTAYISGKQQDVVQLYFGNSPKSSLLITKVDANDGSPLSDVEFLVTTSDGTLVGNANGKYVTDRAGTILIENLDPNLTLVVKETRSKPNYILDDVPQAIRTKPGETVKLEFRNKKQGNLIIHKLSSADKSPIEGAQFKITYADGKVVDAAGGQLSSNGLYTSNKEGQIVLSNVTGTIICTEVSSAPGFAIDPNTRTQTVVVNPGDDTQSLYFYNTPLCSLTLSKVDSVTGKPIPNTTFTVKYASGELIGRYTTGKDGTVTVSGLLPGSTVVVTEYKVPDTHVLNTTPQTITLKSGSNTVTSGAVSGGTGGGNNLDFENDPKMTLTIRKYIKGTNREPLAGVCFKVTEGSGAPVGPGDGTYYTNSTGEIVIEGLEPGTTVTAREISTVEGFVLDGEPKTVKIQAGKQAPELIFWNERAGSLVIQKKNSLDGSPLAGVQFQLTYADGSYVDYDNGHMSSKGLYETDVAGEIRINNIVGTVIAKELKTLPNFAIDPATQTQTVSIRPGDCQTLAFYNTPVGNFELVKVVEGNESQRIPNVTFEIRRASDGGLVDTITTGSDGRVSLQLDAGNYYAVETECPKEFKLDPTPHYFTMRDGGKGTTLTVKNKAFAGILIHKTDSVTGKGIQGVSFLLYDAANNPIGQYTSDDQGYVYIEDLVDGGRYYLRELDNEGYVPDTQRKTVYVKAGEVTLIEWQNTPITGQIQIKKTSEDYNSMNGWPAGAPIPGTEFEIYHYRTGNLVDTVRTDKNGVAVSRPLPLGRYKIVESKAADFYGLDKTPIEAEIKHAGQIVKVAMTNKALSTNVSIKKTGYAEVMPGQGIRYTFSDIGNNSTTALTSYYWRDTLPTQAVRLYKIFTGTYNAPGNYKVVYKTNLSNGEYRTMYDNLSTAKNYTLEAGPSALGLASNEYVTEFMFVFGVVPANFRQVEAPRVDCKVLPTVKGGSSFTNNADVGGVYNGQWIQAVTRWTTKVYGKPPKLPTTGY